MNNIMADTKMRESISEGDYAATIDGKGTHE